VVIGSAVLYELGILTGDIDDVDIVLLKSKIWEEFARTYKVIDVLYGKAVRLGRAFPNPWSIEFLDCIGPPEFNYMTKEGIVSGGINFITLENLIEYKRLLNRKKDKFDIELIEIYLQQRRCSIS
jgi:hypothetical protein